jgi:hypothetical protein
MAKPMAKSNLMAKRKLTPTPKSTPDGNSGKGAHLLGTWQAMASWKLVHFAPLAPTPKSGA